MACTDRVPQVLLVEDSEDDAFFFQRVARRAELAIEIQHVTNGLAAVEVLKKTVNAREVGAAPPPDLIFLDLKLPDFDGFEVLSWVQKQPSLPKLNIVVLSGSEDANDIHRAKSLGAIACFAKPIKVEQLRAIMSACGLHLTPSGATALSSAGKPASA